MPATVELKNFDYAGKTDKGLVRTNNEDYLGYFDTINGHVFVVCDGMGGLNSGEVAASIAVASIKYFFLTYLNKDIKKGIRESLEYANKQIIKKASENETNAKMGTTIVLVIVINTKIYYAHLGDSRIYFFRRGVLEQLTQDHSYIQDLINKGEITIEQSKNHQRRSEITKALGLSTKIKPTICRKPLISSPNDIILLCTDGLNSMLDDNQINEIIIENSESSQKIANELVDCANKNGGIDNTTVQIIKFHTFSQKNDNFEQDFPETTSKTKKLNSFVKNLIITILVIITVIFGNYIYFSKIYTEKISKKVKQSEFLSVSILADKNNINQSLNEYYNIDSNKKYIRFSIKKKYKFEVYDEWILLEKKFKIDENLLKKINNIKNDYILAGSEIIIPKVK